MVLGWFAAEAVHGLVAYRAATLSASLLHPPILGLVVNLAFSACLLFWPGKADDDSARATTSPSNGGQFASAAAQRANLGQAGTFSAVPGSGLNPPFWWATGLTFSAVFLTAMLALTRVR